VRGTCCHHTSTGWVTNAGSRPRLPPRQRGSELSAASMTGNEVHMLDLILLLDARYDGRLTGSAVEMGAAPGGGHGQPPRGRASRLSRGAGGALWRTAGGARKAEARPAATEDEPKISNPNLVIPCGKVGLVYLDGCSALRPRPVYTRVHDLGCKATPDTYGSLRYVYLQLPNIL
jgi:hypothetical protein